MAVHPKTEKELKRECEKLREDRKGRTKKVRIGGAYVSEPLAQALEDFSTKIGIHKTDIIEGLLSKLLRVN